MIQPYFHKKIGAMKTLARKFEGTINFQQQDVPVLFSTVGKREIPDLIVTTLNVRLGVIMKPTLNHDGWYEIDQASQALSLESRAQLEKQLNQIIKERGKPVDCHFELCPAQ